MNINEFYDRYNFTDNLMRRVSGVSPNSIKAMRTGKNVRPKTRAKIEAVMQCVIKNDFIWPTANLGFDKVRKGEAKQRQRYIFNTIQYYLDRRGLKSNAIF